MPRFQSPLAKLTIVWAKQKTRPTPTGLNLKARARETCLLLNFGSY
jgi:hypothetical protein